MPAPQGGSRPRALLSVAALIGVVLLLPVLLPPADIQKYYLALLLVALTLLPLVARAASGTLDVFEPIIPISALIGISFGIRTMYIAYEPVPINQIFQGNLPFYDYIDRGMILAIAAYCSLLAGYFVVSAPIRVTPLAEWTLARTRWPSRLDGRKIAVLIGVALVGSLMHRNAMGSEEVTSATTVLGTLAFFAQIVTLVLALYLAAGDRSLWLRATAWGICLPLAAWQSVAFLSKGTFLHFLYVVVAARHYAKSRLRTPVIAVVGALAMLFIFPTVGILRGGGDSRTANELQGTVNGLGQQVAEVGRRISRMSPGEYAEFAVEGVMARSTGIDTLSLLLKYDMSKELGDPASYALVPAYAFIPRIVWPSKPVIDQAARFGRLLFIASFAGAQSTTAFGITHVGDLLVSFGIPGVIIGMCLLGCLYRLLYKLFDPLNATDLGIKCVYVLLLWEIVNGFEGDVPSTFATALKNLAIWFAIKIWLNRPSPHAMRHAHATMPRPQAPPRTHIATRHAADLLPPSARSRLAP